MCVLLVIGLIAAEPVIEILPESAVKQGDQVSSLMMQSFLYTTAAKLGNMPVTYQCRVSVAATAWCIHNKLPHVWWISLECEYVLLGGLLQVTIRCRLNDRSFTDTNIISRHINGVHHNIAINNNIKEPFDADPRYSTTPQTQPVDFAEVIISGAYTRRRQSRIHVRACTCTYCSLRLVINSAQGC